MRTFIKKSMTSMPETRAFEGLIIISVLFAKKDSEIVFGLVGTNNYMISESKKIGQK